MYHVCFQQIITTLKEYTESLFLVLKSMSGQLSVWEESHLLL